MNVRERKFESHSIFSIIFTFFISIHVLIYEISIGFLLLD